jgi:agmatinase
MANFIDSFFSQKEANVILFGIPLGKHSVDALDSLRDVSGFIEPMDLDKENNLLENVRIYDAGNLKLDSLEEITEKTKEILEMKKIPLILGGGHLLSLFSLQAYDKKPKLIVFDAHGDFKDSYKDEKIEEMNFVKNIDFDDKNNDATWLRRLSEKFDTKNILLLGIRSCDEFQFTALKQSRINYFTSKKIRENLDDVIKFIEDFTRDSDVYISVDIDTFDPSIAPAVDMPEVDGLLFREFAKIINSVAGKIVGTDLTCLKPIKDNQVTEFLAVKVIFEILGKI